MRLIPAASTRRQRESSPISSMTARRLPIQPSAGISRRNTNSISTADSPEQRATACAFEKMLEDHLYWTVVYARFIDEANFAKGPSTFFRAISAPVRPLVVAMVRRQVTRYMRNAPLQFAPKDW